MADHGIDYGAGTCNVSESGIRYGVVPMNALSEWAWESFEADYGNPTCPKCGNDAVDGDSDLPEDEQDYCLTCEHNHGNRFKGGKDAVVKDSRCHDCDCCEPSWAEDRGHYEVLHHACGDYACDHCKILFDGEHAYGDEPLGHTLDDGEYKATMGGDDTDVFLLSSPYFTYAKFCSPCAPGACYLLNPILSPEEADTMHPLKMNSLLTEAHNNRAFCFGHDWFEGDVAPYPVFHVSDGSLVKPERKEKS